MKNLVHLIINQDGNSSQELTSCVRSFLMPILIDWAFHHYREARDQKEPLKKHPELERLLREEYRSLDDFRAKEKAAREGSSSNHSGSCDRERSHF